MIQDVASLLDKAGTIYQEVTARSDEFRINCPFCEDSRFRCYLNQDKRVYHCFNCDRSGRLNSVLKELGINIGGKQSLQSLRKWQKHKSKRTKKMYKELVPVPLPRGYEKLTPEKKSPMAKRAAEYLLKKRGLDWETVLKWEIGISLDPDFMGFLIFPIWNEEGKQIGYQTRRYFALGKRYKNPVAQEYNYSPRDILYGIHLWEPWTKTVVLVEGPFDSIAVNRKTGGKTMACALLGGNLSYSNMMLLRELGSQMSLRRIVVMLDPDALEKAKGIRKALAGVVGVPVKLARIDSDPDELSKKRLRAILSKIKKGL